MLVPSGNRPVAVGKDRLQEEGRSNTMIAPMCPEGNEIDAASRPRWLHVRGLRALVTDYVMSVPKPDARWTGPKFGRPKPSLSVSRGLISPQKTGVAPC